MEVIDEHNVCLCENYNLGEWVDGEFVYYNPLTLKRKKELAKDSCDLHGEPR